MGQPVTDIYLPTKAIPLCCPFCGSNDLTENLWSLDTGEIDAIECNNCLAGAPLTAWNKRESGARLDFWYNVKQLHNRLITSFNNESN